MKFDLSRTNYLFAEARLKTLGAVFIGVFLLSGCGGVKKPIPVSERLPNKVVPLDQNVEDDTDDLADTNDAEASDESIPDDTDFNVEGSVENATENTVGNRADKSFNKEKESEVAKLKKQVSVPENRFDLSDESLLLGLMSESDYLVMQKLWVGSLTPACNFFLITALCESGYCEVSKPFFRAGEFDIYLMAVGFKKSTLAELKEMLRQRVAGIENLQFDVVLQKQNPISDRPGHVMVPVGIDEDTNQVVVAQGSLNKVTNEIRKVSDGFINNWQGGFTVFIRARN